MAVIKMKKNIVQDVVPPGGRSIRNIELPSRRAAREKEPERDIDEAEPVVPRSPEPPKPPRSVPMHKMSDPEPEPEPDRIEPPSYHYTYDEPRKSSRKVLYTSLAIFLLAAAFGISALFKSASISFTPRHETAGLNAVFTAKKNATGADLGFQLVTVSKDVEKTVAATGQQKVDTKASGTIVIYNENTASQKLIATTRFATSDGLVYRLNAAVTVPGKQTVGGKSVAGSIAAQVTADASGDKYNIGLSDFTLPALKGDPKYQTIYARSKTSMAGGFSGMQKTVSSADMASAESELTASLKDELLKDITSQIPANFALYSQDVSYDLDPISQAPNATGDASQATLEKKGTAYALIFDKTILTQAIVSRSLASASADQVSIANLEDLNFAYPSTTSAVASASQISFTLSGSPQFVWVVDENKLKSDLLGLTKTQAQAVLSSYKGIQEAWVSTQPFWNQTIPNDQKKVTVVNTMSK